MAIHGHKFKQKHKAQAKKKSIPTDFFTIGRNGRRCPIFLQTGIGSLLRSNKNIAAFDHAGKSYTTEKICCLNAKTCKADHKKSQNVNAATEINALFTRSDSNYAPIYL